MNIRKICDNVIRKNHITDNTSQITKCTIKVNYNYTLPWEASKIFSIFVGVPEHLFPSSR